jgi:hypothetical protein
MSRPTPRVRRLAAVVGGLAVIGHVVVALTEVEASDNGQQGIEYEEDDDVNGGGDLVATLKSITTLRNGDDGIKLEEDGAGDLRGRIVATASSDNGDAGAGLEQEAPGVGTIQLVDFVATGNGRWAVGDRRGRLGHRDPVGCRWVARVDARLAPPAPCPSDDADSPLLDHVYALAAPPCGGWGLRSRAPDTT